MPFSDFKERLDNIITRASLEQRSLLPCDLMDRNSNTGQKKNWLCRQIPNRTVKRSLGSFTLWSHSGESVLHTVRFEKWSSNGGMLWCCTEGVEDKLGASTTAATMAQHLSSSRQDKIRNSSKVLYIDVTDMTDFAGRTVEKRSERFWVEKLIFDALALRASTAATLQLLLEDLTVDDFRVLSSMVTTTGRDFGGPFPLREELVLLTHTTASLIISIDIIQGYGDDIEDILIPLLDTIAHNIHVVCSSSSEPALADIVQAQVKKNTECQDCLESLAFDKQDTRRSQIAHSIQDTNTWIWHHPHYLAWASDRSSILCIEGKAGSGNTRGGRTLMSHTSLLRSVLHQILQKYPCTFQHMSKAYRCHKPGSIDLWESLPAMQGILNDIVATGFEVLVLIDAMDEAESDRDGIHNRRALLAFLRELVVNADESRLKIIVSSRPLLDMDMEVWRHQSDFENMHRIILQDENHDTICTIVERGIEALRKAIRSWNDDSRKYPNATNGTTSRTSGTSKKRTFSQFQSKQNEREEAMLARTKKYLLDNANGVILWVTSVLNILESTIRKTKYTFAELELKLKSLPFELSGLYRYYVEDLERRVDHKEMLKIRRALMFVSGANAIRSYVTLEELLDALATPSHIEEALKSDLDPIEQGRIHIRSWTDFWWTLHDMCGPLVEVVSIRTEKTHPAHGEDDIDAEYSVQLSHRTVKDFLARPESAGVLAFEDEEAAAFVQETLRNYAIIVMPPAPTPYTGPADRADSDWKHAVESMAEYLDDKRLLPWIINTFPTTQKERWESFGIFCARVQNACNGKLVCRFGPLQPTTSRSAVEHTGGTVNTHFIDYACSNGLRIAVKVFLEILLLGLDPHINYAVYDAVLLVAIRHEMVDSINVDLDTSISEPDYRFWIEEEHDVLGELQYLNPFEIAAAQTGNEALAKIIYDRNTRAQKGMPWDLWPLLSKGRKCWRRSSKDWERYQEYTRRLKSEREHVHNSVADYVSSCITQVRYWEALRILEHNNALFLNRQSLVEPIPVEHMEPGSLVFTARPSRTTSRM
ncbi:hypothetical protein C7974DRAFT_443080 [Boeremia exigua]|uniref:uncharacterized protein n=1 Tax=Boeremia exigua TaxID=749465 RepID=UPI001E8EAB02|nr:uncharacterized protein C7974DRAFT_443080 [Boeremia exigua]KAH6615019.1 hypothetical protein C7974DRAFT_443080 [Boeremia exigua]